MEPSIAEMTMPIETAASDSHTSGNSQTEIRVEYIKHHWTVKNFSHCYQEYLENYVSLPRGEDILTWSIKIYPKGNGENNKDFVFLCLNRVTANNVKNNKIGFRSRFFLKNKDGKDIDMRIHPNPSHSDYVSYIKRDILFPQILPSDSITVFVEIDVAVETITTTADEPITVCTYEKQFSEDCLKLLTESIMTDFVIMVGEREIPVHKVILAARSPVFAAMLNHEDTTEAKLGILKIKDMDYNVAKEMMNFIYSGRCTPEINEIASDLLIAADKYRPIVIEILVDKVQVSNIPESHTAMYCFQAMAICQENACQLLIIGDLYRAELLRKRTVQFILQHPNSITSTAGWETLLANHPQLVTGIVRSFEKPCGPQSHITGSTMFGGSNAENCSSNVSLSHMFTNDR